MVENAGNVILITTLTTLRILCIIILIVSDSVFHQSIIDFIKARGSNWGKFYIYKCNTSRLSKIIDIVEYNMIEWLYI